MHFHLFCCVPLISFICSFASFVLLRKKSSFVLLRKVHLFYLFYESSFCFLHFLCEEGATSILNIRIYCDYISPETFAFYLPRVLQVSVLLYSTFKTSAFYRCCIQKPQNIQNGAFFKSS